MGRIKIKGATIAVGITMGLLFLFYGKFVASPNDYLFASTGDGAKAYYVYAYHIKYDTSYHQLQGMNYPFGQTYIYTDGQPAIANTVKLICETFPAVEKYSIGIYNVIILLSFIFSAWLLYKILRKCGLPEYYSAFFAALINIMSPQFFRLSGHLTLTYICFFPLLWYLLIKYFEKGSNKYLYTLLLIANGAFWGMIHPYYLPAQTFFLAGVFMLNYLFFYRGWQINLKATLLALFQVIIPVLVIKLFDNWVDFHPGRPEKPSGFFDYTATWNTIFLPAFQYPYKYFESFLGKLKDTNWEGTAYIGLVANIALIVAILSIIIKLFTRRRKEFFKNALPFPIKIGFGPAVLLLLLAMAFPFTLNKSLAEFSQHIPYLRQFRSLGRFAWPFYYFATVYAGWAFYKYYQFFKMRGQPIIANCIMVGVFCVFTVEGYIYHYSLKGWIPLGDNFFKEEVYKKKYGEIADFTNWQEKYQAALSIPYFRIGAENYGLLGTEESTTLSFAFSYHTGIPLLASSAARTPAIEAAIALQFFAPPFDKKNIAPYLPSNKDFLVLSTDEKIKATQQNELLEKCTPILSSGMYSLLSYKLNLNYKKAANDSLTAFEQKRSKLYYHKGFYFDKPDTVGFYYWPLDTFKAEKVFEGKGAYGSGDAFRIIMADLKLKLNPEKEYVFSFWHYNVGDECTAPYLAIEEGDSLGKNRNWNNNVNLRDGYAIYKNWTFYEYTFRPQFKNGITTLLVAAENTVGYKTYEDEIMIRPAGVNVYKPIMVGSRKGLNYNNYRIALPD